MSQTIQAYTDPRWPGVVIESGIRHPEFYAKHYDRLVGKKIKGIQLEVFEGQTLAVLLIDDGPVVSAAVMCDPEGNGPGHLDIVTR
jgi:hypothetical protein